MFPHQCVTENRATSDYLEADDEGKKLHRKVRTAREYEDGEEFIQQDP